MWKHLYMLWGLILTGPTDLQCLHFRPQTVQCRYKLMEEAAYEYLLHNNPTTVHWLLCTTGVSLHRWQKECRDGNIVLFFLGFFFLLWGRLFVISHLMLTCKLLRARVTIADDSFVLSPLRFWLLMLWFSWKSTLAVRQMRHRERKHRLENTLKAPVSKSVVSLEAVGGFWPRRLFFYTKFKVSVSPFLHDFTNMLWYC